MGQQSVDVSWDLPLPIVPPPLPPSRQNNGARLAILSMARPLAKLFSYRKLCKSGHLRHQNRTTDSLSPFLNEPNSFLDTPADTYSGLSTGNQHPSQCRTEYFSLSRSSYGFPNENLYTGRNMTAFPEYFDIPNRYEIASYHEAGELPRSPSVRVDNI